MWLELSLFSKIWSLMHFSFIRSCAEKKNVNHIKSHLTEKFDFQGSKKSVQGTFKSVIILNTKPIFKEIVYWDWGIECNPNKQQLSFVLNKLQKEKAAG